MSNLTNQVPMVDNHLIDEVSRKYNIKMLSAVRKQASISFYDYIRSNGVNDIEDRSILRYKKYLGFDIETRYSMEMYKYKSPTYGLVVTYLMQNKRSAMDYSPVYSYLYFIAPVTSKSHLNANKASKVLNDLKIEVNPRVLLDRVPRSSNRNVSDTLASTYVYLYKHPEAWMYAYEKINKEGRAELYKLTKKFMSEHGIHAKKYSSKI